MSVQIDTALVRAWQQRHGMKRLGTTPPTWSGEPCLVVRN